MHLIRESYTFNMTSVTELQQTQNVFVELSSACIMRHEYNKIIQSESHATWKGLLILKFDRATRPFLKIDMRHEAYRYV